MSHTVGFYLSTVDDDETSDVTGNYIVIVTINDVINDVINNIIDSASSTHGLPFAKHRLPPGIRIKNSTVHVQWKSQFILFCREC